MTKSKVSRYIDLWKKIQKMKEEKDKIRDQMGDLWDEMDDLERHRTNKLRTELVRLKKNG